MDFFQFTGPMPIHELRYFGKLRVFFYNPLLTTKSPHNLTMIIHVNILVTKQNTTCQARNEHSSAYKDNSNFLTHGRQ